MKSLAIYFGDHVEPSFSRPVTQRQRRGREQPATRSRISDDLVPSVLSFNKSYKLPAQTPYLGSASHPTDAHHQHNTYRPIKMSKFQKRRQLRVMTWIMQQLKLWTDLQRRISHGVLSARCTPAAGLAPLPTSAGAIAPLIV
ncbi:hypothetical protein EVAR_95931_1 [Eumeta japonica]|uniref:Uncharacterized protein n=1 Tax=Eumeta variegata TaxID=151549 RepID=A0A4C1V964_EUMVA|nr:hypothetical protein EVAR_95931_1 [Eumeta japonica]